MSLNLAKSARRRSPKPFRNAIRPYMSGVFETWSESAMKNLTLTSVGIAIGHANIKRLVGEFSNLSIWIN